MMHDGERLCFAHLQVLGNQRQLLPGQLVNRERKAFQGSRHGHTNLPKRAAVPQMPAQINTVRSKDGIMADSRAGSRDAFRISLNILICFHVFHGVFTVITYFFTFNSRFFTVANLLRSSTQVLRQTPTWFPCEFGHTGFKCEENNLKSIDYFAKRFRLRLRLSWSKISASSTMLINVDYIIIYVHIWGKHFIANSTTEIHQETPGAKTHLPFGSKWRHPAR